MVFDELINDIKIAVNRNIFDFKLPYIQIGIMQEEAPWQDFDNTSGCFSMERLHILINRDYESIDSLINTVFHELTHYYCALHKIQDTEQTEYTYHNFRFKREIERHGGTCSYVNDLIGYNDARLKYPAMKSVKEYLHYLQRKG